MATHPPQPLTPEAARDLHRMHRAEIAPGLTERELDAVEARFGFTFSADHRVFLAAGLPHGSRSWPDWRGGDPEDLAGRLSAPVDGVLFDVEHGFWHPGWPARPAARAEALRIARAELASVPQLVPVYGHRYLPGTAGESGHPVLSVHQTDVIFYGNDLSDYVRREFTGRSSGLPARATVGFWSYFVNGGPGIDVTAPTPHSPCATSAPEAVDYLRMLALERLIGRRHHPHQLVEAGLTALVLGVETESVPVLAGLSRAEHERAEPLFGRVLAELALPETDVTAEAARWELVRWWLRMIVGGSMAPADGGDLITHEGWGALDRPEPLRPLVETVEAHHTADGTRRGARERAIVTEAERLLAGPWPPAD
ncbi:hypothetical protein ABZ891_32790 [Streptomyces sp. NPDC047023]|uniref:hypothetical protein n=1 Tax=Streptomyces sp. NPDC047023 TaxID=3155139 RepID=UPI0033FFF7CA